MDKELIKQEIERIIEEETPISKGSDYYHGAKESMEKLLQFIDSLPEESGCEVNCTTKNEDLEEELYSWMRENCDDNGFFNQLELAHHFAEWKKQQMKETLQTEYEKGRFDMRDEMMKDAVEAEVMYPASSSTLQIRYKLPKNTKLKYGDKVKIIIIKEEQQ